MTNLALLRDPGCSVIRIVRSLKILQMARSARRRRDVVVSIRVALCARNLSVCPSQGEGRFRMIKRGWLPCGRGVADLALLRDAGGQVVWVRGALEVLDVARDACRRGQVEISVGVTLIALQLRVSSR
jgi:hypothetical protein